MCIYLRKILEGSTATEKKFERKNLLWSRIYYYRIFLLMLIPVVLYYLVFSYAPMCGLVVAFREFSYKNLFGVGWVGLKHFKHIFEDDAFIKAIYNTIIISFGRVIFEFPVPVILALLMNEIRNSRHKRIFQTIYTFPHFISWVVVGGIIYKLFAGSGLVNQIIAATGGERVGFLTDGGSFLTLVFSSNIVKEAGWSTIIYLATIAGINPEMYESAIVDGAKRFAVVRFITWPSIMPVAVLLLVLSIGNTMSAGFEQIFNMYNPSVYNVSDIIDTAIYRRTFKDGLNFSYSTAFGMFKSVVNMILLFAANAVAKKMGENSIF